MQPLKWKMGRQRVPIRKGVTLTRFLRNRRGVVLTEYALLLLAFGLPTIAGMYVAGAMLVHSYQSIRDQVLSDCP